MTPYEIMKALREEDNGIRELAHLTTFRGYRERKDGTTEQFTVDILDDGPDVNQMYRYNAVVTTASGKVVTGNGAESLRSALSIVHWNALD